VIAGRLRLGRHRLRGDLARLRWRWNRRFGGPHVIVGRNLVLGAPLTIRGSGTVRLGDHVRVDRATVLYTVSKDAVIEIGDNAYLNGPRISAAAAVRIGPGCLLGDARIMDTDFHHTNKRRRTPQGPSPARPIEIGANVWIGAWAGILKGVTIGENSIVAFGAVVTSDVPPDRIVAGNPARDIGAVPD
jgi:acetyltransferase-like isoleucine patch superfamily enzyme